MTCSMTTRTDSLAIPDIKDSIALLHSKLIALSKVIPTGKSIAVATKFAAVPYQERDATKKAIRQMTPPELVYWNAYTENRIQLPQIDWLRDIGTTPTSPMSLRLARRRAEALNYLYRTDQAQPGHSVWFVENQLVCLPLVKAMARVIGAERDLLGGQCVLTAMQLADLQTLSHVLSISGRIIEIHRKESIPPGLGHAQAILGSQREQLRVLRGGVKRKRPVSPP